MTQIALEGWCTDPFEIHEARWISAGTPTKLVRDGSVETYEPVPTTSARSEARPLGITAMADHGSDLLRSDVQVRDQRGEMSRAACRILTLTSS